MTTTSNAGGTPEQARQISKISGMSDADFDRWIDRQGGQPVTQELWDKLAKHGVFPELPPHQNTTRAA